MSSKRFWTGRTNESGQATIEMILVLVIGVIVILGLVYRFNTAFKKYTVDLYGTYYRCLLETGELPGVGSVCRDKDARFNIANGRALLKESPGSGGSGPGSGGSGTPGSGGSGTPGRGGSGSGGSSGGPKSGSGGSGTKGNQANSGSGSGSDSGGSGSGAGSEAVGGSSSSSGGGRGSVVGRLSRLSRSRSTAVGNVGGAGGAGSDGNEKPEPLSTYSSNGSRSGSDSLRRGRTKMDFAVDGDNYQRAETKAVSSVSASAVKKTDRKDDSLRPRKAVENTSRQPAAKRGEDSGGGLEFGRMFRMFLIFGIIVAIVVFLGGQVLQISKSGDR